MSEPTITVAGNQLVIYYDQPPPPDGPKISIDEFALISEGEETTLTKMVKVSEISKNVGEVVKSSKSESSSTADTVATPTPNEILGVMATFVADFEKIGNVQSFEVKPLEDWRPWVTGTESTLTTDKVIVEYKSETVDYFGFEPKTTTTITVTPNPNTPVTVEKTPQQDKPEADERPAPDAGNPPGTDGGNPPSPDAGNPPGSGKVPYEIAPPDEAWVHDEVADSFVSIMSKFGTMNFSTSEGADAYLQYQLDKAGIEMKVISTGMKVEDAGAADPAGVEAHLRELGINDQNLIERVRTEANDAIRLFEQNIGLLRADLSALDPDDPKFDDDVAAAIQRWNGELGSQLNSDVPEVLKSNDPVTVDVTNGIVTMTAPAPYSTMVNGRISPTGLIIRAGIGLRDSAKLPSSATTESGPATQPSGPTTAGPNSQVLGPGFYPAPDISVFDENAWIIEA